MELTDLKYFYNVATAGSFSRGAQLSHVSPPAISKAVKRLERELSAELFDRTTRRVGLTDDGRILLTHCEKVFAQLEALHRDLADTDHRIRGELRMAANEVFSTYLLPHALSGLAKQNPDLRPRCYEMIPERMAHWLRHGRLDVAFTIGATPTDGIECHPITSSPGVLVCGPGHPLYDKGEVTQDDLITYPSVVPEFFQREFLPALDQFPRDMPRTIACTIELLQMAVQLCLDGAYLGYFPEVAIRCHLRHDELKTLSGLPDRPPFELSAMTRKGIRPRASVRALIQELEAVIKAGDSPTCG